MDVKPHCTVPGLLTIASRIMDWRPWSKDGTELKVDLTETEGASCFEKVTNEQIFPSEGFGNGCSLNAAAAEILFFFLLRIRASQDAAMP